MTAAFDLAGFLHANRDFTSLENAISSVIEVAHALLIEPSI
ncbi:hypothetical protein NB311A_01974 [Nitrobacter sp. Nb-311A]|nr:hypothetical protein NB311A_01974 [Nitrobacter sp. Nb-311A]